MAYKLNPVQLNQNNVNIQQIGDHNVINVKLSINI
jgi:hypothetical protein